MNLQILSKFPHNIVISRGGDALPYSNFHHIYFLYTFNIIQHKIQYHKKQYKRALYKYILSVKHL